MDTPYQTPSSVDSAPGVSASIKLPALFLILLAAPTLLLDVPIGYINVFDAARFIAIDGFFSVATVVVIVTGTLIVVHLIILIGAIKMFRASSYRFAKIAAILSVVPLCSPGFILGIPFGIWALVALSKDGVPELFATDANR